MRNKPRPMVGDTVILASEHLRPAYLCGARVKLTGCYAATRGRRPGFHSDDETRWWRYNGKILSMLQGGGSRARFNVGDNISGITESMIYEIVETLDAAETAA